MQYLKQNITIMKNNPEIALLIDAENYREPARIFTEFLEKLQSYGSVSKKIAFGNWGRIRYLKNWIQTCDLYNIDRIGLQGYSGKNAADKSLIHSASTLLSQGEFDYLAIYSRDMGFSLAFSGFRIFKTKIIAPKYQNRFIPDADIYIDLKNSIQYMPAPTSEFGFLLQNAIVSRSNING